MSTGDAIHKRQRAYTSEHAAARSRIYQLFQVAFSFPDSAFYEGVSQGRWQDEVMSNLAALPYSVPAPEDGLRRVPTAHDEFQVEYNRLFEIGIMGGPPCPLYGGHYEKDRMRVMEEVVRFYNFFRLRLFQDKRILPDHITVELDFMAHLARREAAALQQQRDAESYWRAERDFLERHLAKWVPVLHQKLARQNPPPFFGAMVELADEFLRQDRNYLKILLNPQLEYLYQ